MTDIIHIDKEHTGQISQKIRLTAESLYDQAGHVYKSIANSGWEGSSKDEFLHQLYGCTSSLKSLCNSLDLLSFRLSQEIEEWITIGDRFHS